MSDTVTSVLRVLRNPKLVNGIGLGLVALVGLWLVVNFVKGPQEFVNVALDGLTRGSIYGVVALGYTLVYGILQLINFAHGDVFSLSGLVASTILLSVLGLTGDSSNLVVIGGIIVTLAITIPLFAVINATIERVAYRPLRHAPRLTPLITAVGMSFIVSNISLALYGVDYESGSDLIPQGSAFTTARSTSRGSWSSRSRSSSPPSSRSAGSSATRGRARRCAPSRRTRRRRR